MEDLRAWHEGARLGVNKKSGSSALSTSRPNSWSSRRTHNIMATKQSLRPLLRSANLSKISYCARVSFSTSIHRQQEAPKAQSPGQDKYTHFGYEDVREEEKQKRGLSIDCHLSYQ